MTSYNELPGLEHLYLEDSWVLEISEAPTSLRFVLDAVLTESHPQWKPASPGEQHCYRRLLLAFENADEIELVPSGLRPAIDASGEQDFGNIDSFTFAGRRHELEGAWGQAVVEGEPPSVVDWPRTR